MEPQLYYPKPSPVQAMQYDGGNLKAVQEFMGDALQKTVPQFPHREGYVLLSFKEWSCDLNPTDWIVKYASDDVLVFDDTSFHGAYVSALVAR